jgi:hypothetical protein
LPESGKTTHQKKNATLKSANHGTPLFQAAAPILLIYPTAKALLQKLPQKEESAA